MAYIRWVVALVALAWCAGIYFYVQVRTESIGLVVAYETGGPDDPVKQVADCAPRDIPQSKQRVTSSGESYLLRLCFKPMISAAYDLTPQGKLVPTTTGLEDTIPWPSPDGRIAYESAREDEVRAYMAARFSALAPAGTAFEKAHGVLADWRRAVTVNAVELAIGGLVILLISSAVIARLGRPYTG